MADRDKWRELADSWGLPDVDIDLLRQALTHASFVREANGDATQSNQRLEFLGDAVLDLLVAEHLCQRRPELTEGELTKLKAGVVREQALVRVAADLRLGEYLRLGRGEEETCGRHKPSLLADALEAVIGALWQSLGLEAARQFVLTRFAAALDEVNSEAAVGYDHKSKLQELLQAHTKQTPAYVTTATEGPPHNRTFTAEVRFDDLPLGRGSGASKQSAEQAASRQALDEQTQWLPKVQATEQQRPDTGK